MCNDPDDPTGADVVRGESTEAGTNSQITTDVRNKNTVTTATIVPMPPAAMRTRAKRSIQATVQRVLRTRVRPVIDFGEEADMITARAF